MRTAADGTSRAGHDSTDQQYVSRLDYQLDTNKRMFVRDFFAFFKSPAFDLANNLIEASAGNGTNARQHTIATGLDYVITQHLFSSTRFSYQHTARGTGERGRRAHAWGVRREMRGCTTKARFPGRT